MKVGFKTTDPSVDAPSFRGSWPRVFRVVTAVTLLSLLPGLAIARQFLVRDHFPVCFFRVCTGIPCPFCGLTRACALGLTGEFRAAFSQNLLWPVAIAAMFLSGVFLFCDGIWKTRFSHRFADRLMNHAWLLLIGVVAVWLLSM